jgi:hypothetical protein
LELSGRLVFLLELRAFVCRVKREKLYVSRIPASKGDLELAVAMEEDKPVLVKVDFLGVVGGIFSLSSTFPRLVVLQGLDANATILSELSEG